MSDMTVAILAGGSGTRLAEETSVRPKPLVPIGSQPILWHIMRTYAHYGFTDFVLAAGYLGEMVREFGNDVGRGGMREQDWSVRVVDTGPHTNTGGRILRLRDDVGAGTFLLTWGDGVSDVDILKLVNFHRAHGRLATLTAVHPPSRFGRLTLAADRVERFEEKPRLTDDWINGAFFVLEPRIFEFIDGDETSWEHDSLPRLAEAGELMAFRHDSFWQCMDTVHDRDLLNEMWQSGQAPWRVWD